MVELLAVDLEIQVQVSWIAGGFADIKKKDVAGQDCHPKIHLRESRLKT